MSDAATDLRTCHLRIRGRVQGVGFRMYFQREAERHGVAGWVRNRNDGSVEAIIHGGHAAVQKLIGWAHRGPSHASVTAVDVSDAEGVYSGFEQRATA
jgi:acylphosphatase